MHTADNKFLDQSNLTQRFESYNLYLVIKFMQL